MHTKGLSMIIASVLTVLLTVAAVSILWMSTQPVLEKASTINAAQGPYFEIQKEFSYTVYDPVNGYMSVQVERGGDTLDVIRLKFIIDLEGTSIVRETYNVVDPLQRQVYYFILDKELTSVGPVKVVPIYYINGKEVEGGEFVLETKIPIRRGALRDLILDGAHVGTDPSDEKALGQTDLMYLSLQNVKYDSEQGMLTLQLLRGDDSSVINDIMFEITMEENSEEIVYTIVTDSVPAANTVKTYYMPVWKEKTIKSIAYTPNSDSVSPGDTRLYESLVVDSVLFSLSEIVSLPITFEKDVGYTDGLVFYYSFDDNYVDEVNNRIIDQSGFGHEGVLKDASMNPGDWNLLFNGNQYIDFGGGEGTLYPLGDKTIIFVARPTSYSSNNRLFGAKFNYNFNFYRYNTYGNWITSFLVGYENEGTSFFEYYKDENFLLNQRKFYAVLFEISNKITTFTNEGDIGSDLISQTRTSTDTKKVVTTGQPYDVPDVLILSPNTENENYRKFYLGTYSGDDGTPDVSSLFNGELYEFRIYDKLLTPEEISDINLEISMRLNSQLIN